MYELPQRHDGPRQVATALCHDLAVRVVSSNHDLDSGDVPAHLASLCRSWAGAGLQQLPRIERAGGALEIPGHETRLRGLSCGQVPPDGAREIRASGPGLLHRHGAEGLRGGLSHLHGQYPTNDPDAADRCAPGHWRRMVMKRTIHLQSLALVVATAVVLAVRGASAEPVVDQALADAQMVVQKGCAILKVNFNIRIRYASHFPLDHGDELRITVNPIDRKEATALLGLKREAATVPADKRAGVNSIVLETANPTGPVLRINFDRPVAYRVAADSDTQSIVVAIAGAKP